MFSLLTIEDKILLDPSLFSKLTQPKNKKAKKNEIETHDSDTGINKYSDLVYLKLREKYISKIIVGQGLVISIKSFKIKSDLIVEIEGVIDIKYECCLIIFCPKEGDILYGTIVDCDHNRIIVDCDLIKVIVPVQQLMEPHAFHTKEQLWFWSYDGKKENYYYEKNLKCKLKVLEVSFKTGKDIHQKIEEIMENLSEEDNAKITEEDLMKSLKREDIMEIYCSMSEKGLGPIKWWE